MNPECKNFVSVSPFDDEDSDIWAFMEAAQCSYTIAQAAILTLYQKADSSQDVTSPKTPWKKGLLRLMLSHVQESAEKEAKAEGRPYEKDAVLKALISTGIIEITDNGTADLVKLGENVGRRRRDNQKKATGEARRRAAKKAAGEAAKRAAEEAAKRGATLEPRWSHAGATMEEPWRPRREEKRRERAKALSPKEITPAGAGALPSEAVAEEDWATPEEIHAAFHSDEIEDSPQEPAAPSSGTGAPLDGKSPATGPLEAENGKSESFALESR